MFPQQSNDILDEKPISDSPLYLKSLKPKLISSINYQQEYLLRRHQKRRNRRNQTKSKLIPTSGQSPSSSFFDENENYGIKETSLSSPSYQNNFYRQVYDGNDKISGYWVNGLLQGEAQIQYQNGDYFRGNFQKGYKAQGLMIFKDHGTYQGLFSNQQFHGKGVLRLKDKTISATWTNGIVEGSCVIQYRNGNLYYGPVKQFKKHGYGYLYFPNDTKFFGQFVDNMVKGYGEYYQKGELKSKGLWKNGKLIQQKKQEDWTFNFEEQNINWSLIENIFQKKDNLQGGVSFFSKFLTKAQTFPEDDRKFKSMLESLKKSNIKHGLSHDFTQSERSDSIQQKIDENSIKVKFIKSFN